MNTALISKNVPKIPPTSAPIAVATAHMLIIVVSTLLIRFFWGTFCTIT